MSAIAAGPESPLSHLAIIIKLEPLSE
jgi:hypothetical protein